MANRRGNEQATVWLPPWLRQKLREAAARRNVTQSTIVREALEVHLGEAGKDAA